jgi:predicted nucleic acid-binding protein
MQPATTADLVLDASVTLTAILPEEAHGDVARAILDRVATAGAAVPVLWRIEVGNALLTNERRGRLPAGRVEAICRQLDALPIQPDPETTAHAWGTTIALARKHRLTVYDACYLELAQRRRLKLASFDAALLRAAAAEGIAAA